MWDKNSQRRVYIWVSFLWKPCWSQVWWPPFCWVWQVFYLVIIWFNLWFWGWIVERLVMSVCSFKQFFHGKPRTRVEGHWKLFVLRFKQSLLSADVTDSAKLCTVCAKRNRFFLWFFRLKKHSWQLPKSSQPRPEGQRQRRCWGCLWQLPWCGQPQPGNKEPIGRNGLLG